MSGFVKQLLFGDFGSWWHTQDVHKQSVEKRNQIRESIRKNTSIDEDQEIRIIQLELITGTLMAILREKNQINDDEIKELLAFSEQEAKRAMQAKKSVINSGF
ncbi:MAG: hypothetical protein B6D77_05380 [gamma proteobacterium symbiont of Ctena orbiculata]|nr:MAG: hypothetical protein B6D77_05380 [gamma proteobacterium symbiont of Ctena orbiculata]